jgi:hypothetical protein
MSLFQIKDMEEPLFSIVLQGLAAGLAATAAMTAFELPFWSKWKLTGVFEWHENQVLVSRLFGFDVGRINFIGIFLFHFANGGFGGVGFAFLILLVMPQLVKMTTITAAATTTMMMMVVVTMIPILAFGVLYGLFLWIATLAPTHKPITGLDPWRNPLGKGPALASVAGHVLYGFVLGSIFLSEIAT